MFNLKERDLLILCKNENESEKIRDDLDFIIGVDQIAFLPDEIETNSKEENQIFSFFLNDVLAKIHTNRKNIFITTKEGLESKFPNNDFLSENSYILKINKEIERDELEEILMSFGYKREEMVLYPKDFCVKGSIIDFFPPDRTYPIRIEFFDNIIESMRIFDIEDQISISHLEKYILKPPADSKIAKENATSLFHLLKKDLLVIQNNIDEFDKPLFDTLSGYQKISNYDLFESDLNFDFIHHDLKKNDFKTSKALLNNFVKFQDKKLCIIGNTEEQINKINHLLEIDPIEYVIGNISSGFEFLDHKFIIIPEHEIFKKERQSRSFRNLPKDFNIEKFDIDKVEHGDKMVHEDYGIGEFERMEIISAFGAEKECIVLKYAGDSRVYVPMDKIFKVKKYKATDGIEPQLTTLNSGEWERKKLRTKKSLEKITRELMELYAKRLQTKGYAFEPDTEIQMEMEMEFPWEETPDQISATQEIKNDMESVKPMDRLLCGDVGFGKTEVAIRAAFKAVSNSKQVAILVPTTILSDQHFKSFSDRLRNYPVKIEKLSRFVTAKLQKTIIRDIREGKVDIVISTSKILSKNIEFKDLGLLIIDEEHQFGVKQKEHIKNLAKNIDVLSLTATPIPRTLHFSLIGARDYSQINTPPKFRLPIITEIIRFKEETIIKAVKREIERNGQIYFVHNEIQSIQQVSIKLMEMFPDLKIQWAHGQMKEQELEPIMYDFINQKIDILVTTSIIESGIDIPNVNTIFINNANRFGLAQLYQLRGRVGRTNRRAYCYLITPGISKLNTDAVKRLKTIKRYTSLGSGYSIAMRDLEIRGSGNVFGVEQKGNIQSIGYDLYIKMLKTVMNELKEKEFNEELIDKILNSDSKPPTDIIYPKAAYFSQEYIEVQSLRLNFYKRLAGIQSVEDLENLKKEIMDRFGEPNKQALRLFEITKIKYFAEQIGTRRIIFNGNEVKLEFDKVNILGDDNPKIFTSISEICSDLGVSFRFIPDDNLKMILRIPEKELDNTKQFLDKLYQKFKL
ncbi:MAG: transcription-repair coupling factor [Candidatus Marinimicrobia bacterium]|nr:transcription-repair coupling factor [Candidatus Neomarinimicrobiota bacterium]